MFDNCLSNVPKLGRGLPLGVVFGEFFREGFGDGFGEAFGVSLRDLVGVEETGLGGGRIVGVRGVFGFGGSRLMK